MEGDDKTPEKQPVEPEVKKMNSLDGKIQRKEALVLEEEITLC